jgi:nucleoside-diphosphate-sugar epimerase
MPTRNPDGGEKVPGGRTVPGSSSHSSPRNAARRFGPHRGREPLSRLCAAVRQAESPLYSHRWFSDVVYDSVVTGCAGFIGSHLTEQLIQRGDRVLGIDSFDDYYSAEAKGSNLAALEGQPRFTLVRGDLRTLPLADYFGPETTVFHLAAQPGVRGSWGTNFHRYVENNILATQVVLETLASAPRRGRLAYASSSSVYGEPPDGPTPEDAPTRPISPYGMTKLAGEHLVRLYGRTRGLSTVALRFFTVYGPRQRPDMAFHKFFRAVEKGDPIEVYGDGRQMRDFTYVDDIVAGVLAASESEGEGEVFNLGGGSPVGLETAIRYVGEAAGSPVSIRHVEAQAGDPRSTSADIGRAARVLHYAPRVTLKEGLVRQWAWQGGSEGRRISLAA